MTRRKNEDVSVEFECVALCDDPPTWMVEGRFNAEGEFEPHEEHQTDCPECGEYAEPTDSEVRVREC